MHFDAKNRWAVFGRWCFGSQSPRLIKIFSLCSIDRCKIRSFESVRVIKKSWERNSWAFYSVCKHKVTSYVVSLISGKVIFRSRERKHRQVTALPWGKKTLIDIEVNLMCIWLASCDCVITHLQLYPSLLKHNARAKRVLLSALRKTETNAMFERDSRCCSCDYS